MLKKMIYRAYVLKRLRPYSEGVKKLFGTYFISSLLELGLALILPIFYSMFIEKVILGKKVGILLIVVSGYLTIQILNSGIAFLKNYCHYRVTNQVTLAMKNRILSNYLKKPFAVYENMITTDVKMLLDDDITKITAFADTQTIDYVVALSKMIVISSLLIVMEWRLALFCILIVPVTFLLTQMYGRKSQVFQDLMRKNDERWGDWIYNYINAWREVRAMGLSEKGEDVFREYTKADARYFTTITNFWVSRVLVLPKIKDEFLMQFALYFIGGLLIFRGQMTIGILLVFAQYYSILSEAVQVLTNADAQLQTDMTFYNRVLDAAEEPEDEGKGVVSFQNNDIIFENVSFRYPNGENDVISDLSFQIVEGERVGIVGESGRGKTTILNLLVGILQPTIGEIRFGGVKLEDVSLKALHRKVGFVLQENILFNTSIRENLLYGNRNASLEDMRSSCEKAMIQEFIDDLPDGFDTIIGEKGIKLSGGQKQRMVLARMFLRDVDVLVFDEATSALDQQTEMLVQNTIRNIGKDKTIVVVAHRKSSLELCDRLIYL